MLSIEGKISMSPKEYYVDKLGPAPTGRWAIPVMALPSAGYACQDGVLHELTRVCVVDTGPEQICDLQEPTRIPISMNHAKSSNIGIG